MIPGKGPKESQLSNAYHNTNLILNSLRQSVVSGRACKAFISRIAFCKVRTKTGDPIGRNARRGNSASKRPCRCSTHAHIMLRESPECDCTKNIQMQAFQGPSERNPPAPPTEHIKAGAKQALRTWAASVIKAAAAFIEAQKPETKVQRNRGISLATLEEVEDTTISISAAWIFWDDVRLQVGRKVRVDDADGKALIRYAHPSSKTSYREMTVSGRMNIILHNVHGASTPDSRSGPAHVHIHHDHMCMFVARPHATRK